jgi:uncharacterized repeat protein (TIGR03803 family)
MVSSFHLTRSARLLLAHLTTLHNFTVTDGAYPNGVIQASGGNFYGTTEGGGIGYGTVFTITPAGVLTTLHIFEGNGADNSNAPAAGLVEGTDGKFYGTTYLGYDIGDIFESTAAGAVTYLFNFEGSDGGQPKAALFQPTNGIFYGTTMKGGTSGLGTVFSLSVGLAPFVKTLPTTGPAGAPVVILGTNLTGTTSVTFDGTPAAFTVVSATEITTNVPTGATTGAIQVTTPGGTILSGAAFVVRP